MSRQQHIKQEEFPYLITTVVRGRAKFFEEEKWAGELQKVIVRTCKMFNFTLLGYAIMPYHVHIIVYPNQARAALPAQIGEQRRTATAGRAGGMNMNESRTGDVGKLMHGIKSYFAQQVYKLKPRTHFAWQQGFNSRVLDTTERFQNAMTYIQDNALHHELEVRYTKAPYVYIAKNIPL